MVKQEAKEGEQKKEIILQKLNVMSKTRKEGIVQPLVIFIVWKHNMSGHEDF